MPHLQVHTWKDEALLNHNWHPETAKGQLELLGACELLKYSPGSPLHSQGRSGPGAPVCVIEQLKGFVDEFPVPPDQFGSKMWQLVQDQPQLGGNVGFADETNSKVG